MEFSVLFARHLARLAWLLGHEPGSTDEQKAALRAMVAVTKFGPITVETRDWRVQANGIALPDDTPGVLELVAQMAAHGVQRIRVATGPKAADLLQVARFFSAPPAKNDPAASVREKLAALEAPSVTFDHVPLPGATTDVSPTAPQPAGEPPRVEPETQPVAAPVAARAPEKSQAPQAVEASSSPVVGATPGVVHEEGGGMWMHFSAVQAPKGSAVELFEQLDRFHTLDATTRVLEDLVAIAENAAREGKPHVVADIFHGIVRREHASTQPELRRAFQMAVRRMSRPALLRAVAHLLPRKRDRHDDYVAVLVRTGEDGADALIDQLTQAQTADDRRVFFDVLLHLQAGVPALVHMLGDARWFVARNAADLLGEMKAVQAEEPLKHLLRHQDDRVRRAATTALMGLGTDSARQAIYDAMHDSSPHVRMQAAAALGGGSRNDGKSAGTLTHALDQEADPDVQLAIISALGKVATGEAVQRLIKVAEAEGRVFFRKKPTPLRVAAVQALGEARTAAALSALAELRDDREKEVREAVTRALGRR